MRTWISERLAQRGYPRPLCKRLARLVTGLVAGEAGTLGGVSSTVHGLGITPAEEESVARRVLRSIDDGRLDPEAALPALLADLVPLLVQDAARAHPANAGSGTRQHRRFVGVRVVVDETSEADRVHVLVAGLADRGIVLGLPRFGGSGGISVTAWHSFWSSGAEVPDAPPVLGLVAIRRRDIARHRAWMMRGYALGLGAGTQVLTLLLGEIVLGPPGEVARGLLMGAAWAIDLALAEWIIRRPPSPQARTASPARATGYDQEPGAPVPSAVATP